MGLQLNAPMQQNSELIDYNGGAPKFSLIFSAFELHVSTNIAMHFGAAASENLSSDSGSGSGCHWCSGNTSTSPWVRLLSALGTPTGSGWALRFLSLSEEFVSKRSSNQGQLRYKYHDHDIGARGVSRGESSGLRAMRIG